MYLYQSSAKLFYGFSNVLASELFGAKCGLNASDYSKINQSMAFCDKELEIDETNAKPNKFASSLLKHSSNGLFGEYMQWFRSSLLTANKIVVVSSVCFESLVHII